LVIVVVAVVVLGVNGLHRGVDATGQNRHDNGITCSQRRGITDHRPRRVTRNGISTLQHASWCQRSDHPPRPIELQRGPREQSRGAMPPLDAVEPKRRTAVGAFDDRTELGGPESMLGSRQERLGRALPCVTDHAQLQLRTIDATLRHHGRRSKSMIESAHDRRAIRNSHCRRDRWSTRAVIGDLVTQG
jgi:hypothetical protein